MKNLFILCFNIILILGIGSLSAQPPAPYITPNTGIKYTFDDLVANSAGTVVKEGDVYVMKDDVTISPLDSLWVEEDITVKIFNDKILTINSSFWKVDPPTQATFTNYYSEDYYATIRIEEGSFVRLNKAHFTYGSGIRIINSNFEMDNCEMNNHNYSTIANGAISSTSGKVVVKNSTFKNNVHSAFNSAANIGCTFEITNCHLENNVTNNTNRPQINIGPCQTGETSKIINNTIIGNRSYDMVGGISTSSLLSIPTTYWIEGNTIIDNRYGLTFTGANITGTIKGNIFTDNNTETDPMNGGSAINIYAPSGNTHAIITENIISGSLWGITLVGNTSNFSTGPTANIGNISVPETDPEYNIGKNIFFNNGNNGELFDLYNNNPNDVMAQNNNWGVPEQTEELIRTVIRDKTNNPNYGIVTFMPPYIIETTGTISGIVTEDDEPISDVSITLLPLNLITVSDSNGTYGFDELPAGFYSLSATKEGYYDVTINDIEVVAGEITTQNIAMQIIPNHLYEQQIKSIKIFGIHNTIYIENPNLIPINEVSIFDIYGRTIWNGNLFDTKNVIQLNTTNGVYFVRVTTDAHIFTTKIFNN